MILIPYLPPITVKVFGGDATKIISMADFIEDSLSIDKRAGQNIKTLRSAGEIIKAFRSAETAANDFVKIHSNDFGLLRAIIEEPEHNYMPHTAFQLMQFIEAVLNAKSE